jgi:hypothetical protein
MTPQTLQNALIDLGWLALTQRALGGRPAESYTLWHLKRCAGRPVNIHALASEYQGTGGMMVAASKVRDAESSANAVRKRVERLRAGLADLGCEDAIQTVHGGAYIIARDDVPRIEAAILFGCGYELEQERAA